MIDQLYLTRPGSCDSMETIFQNIEGEVKYSMHNIFRYLLDNIYDEQEMSDKIDGILLEKDEL